MKVALTCVSFGFVLSQSGATDYGFIQATARVSALWNYWDGGLRHRLGLWLLKRYGLTHDRQPLQVPTKPPSGQYRRRGDVWDGGRSPDVPGPCPRKPR